jgi:bacterioferritin-associated ferredoxin
MYVCICKGITDKQIEELYKLKKGNVKEVLKSLGVGSDCGTCVEAACQSLEKKSQKCESKDTPRLK